MTDLHLVNHRHKINKMSTRDNNNESILIILGYKRGYYIELKVRLFWKLLFIRRFDRKKKRHEIVSERVRKGKEN